MAVMFGHVRALFFVPYTQAGNRHFLLGAMYLLTSLGHQAVLVFFVLSGFFISRSVLDAFRKARWSWKIFLVNRLTRLLLVLVPGLLLCAFWDYIGMRLPWASAFYFRAIPALSADAVTTHSSAKIFLGNLLFLQSIYFPSFGSDLPLWSLSYEFWYYLLFAILLIVVLAGSPSGKRLAWAAVGVAIFLMVGRDIALLFLVWLAGAGVGVLHDWKVKSRLSAIPGWSVYGCVCLCLVGLLLARIRVPAGLLSDFLVSAAFLPIMYVLVEAGGATLNQPYANVAKLLASFSYTLYVVHLPFLIFLRTLLGRIPRWQPDLSHAVLGVALAGFVLTYAIMISRVTEARTEAVRRFFLPRKVHFPERTSK